MSSLFARASGLLLHLTSLPARPLDSVPDRNPGTDGAWSSGDVGSGDLGPSAYEFVRFLKQAGQRWWQILPTGPTGYGFSPYQSPSSFAGNPLLISPALLVRDGLLSRTDLAEFSACSNFLLLTQEMIKTAEKTTEVLVGNLIISNLCEN